MGALVEELVSTGTVCAQCDEDLDVQEEVFHVLLAQPVIVDGEPRLLPVLDVNDDLLYDAFFLHFKCWEEIIEELKEEAENTPPVSDEFELLTCDCCGSAIREHEPVMSVTLGELHRSRRSPSNKASFFFDEAGAPDVYCLYCLNQINDFWLEFWSGGVSIDGECRECQSTRCWRGFDCACTCHSGEEANDAVEG